LGRHIKTVRLALAQLPVHLRRVLIRAGNAGRPAQNHSREHDGIAAVGAQNARYLKSFSSVYDVAGHAFELRRGRVILSGVHDAPEAVSPT